jgi:hypothetical protein
MLLVGPACLQAVHDNFLRALAAMTVRRNDFQIGTWWSEADNFEFDDTVGGNG